MSTLKSANELPGLPPLRFLGKRGPAFKLFSDPVQVLNQLYRECGSVCAVAAGNPAMVCAFGPEYNRLVLQDPKRFHNIADFPFPIPANSAAKRLEVNLTSINGDAHRSQRRLMTPAFHNKTLESYRDRMVIAIEECLSKWPSEGDLDISQQMIELTLRIMMRCLFGLEVGDAAGDMGKMGMRFLQQITSPSVILLPVNIPGTPYRKFLTFCEDFERVILRIIEQRRSDTAQPQDALSILIHSTDEEGRKLSDKELIGQAVLLFVAGYETTAFTLDWALFLLAQHPAVYRDLVDELSGRLLGEAPTIEQLKDLPLLDAVVKESMRLIPAVPMLFSRKCTDSVPLGSFELPSGSQIVLSPLITHHMEEIYSEPKKFNPLRWNGFQPSTFEYIPFGAGIRKCLGAGFAELEIKLALSLIVQRYMLKLTPGTVVDYAVRGITLGPKHALHMQVSPQNRVFANAPAVNGTIRRLYEI